MALSHFGQKELDTVVQDWGDHSTRAGDSRPVRSPAILDLPDELLAGSIGE
jgi:hypothetical protein